MNIFLIVGNAAFHSNELYSLLPPAIHPLALALSEKDDKVIFKF